MNLEQQVCSLDLAKRLKELGVKQESYLWWWVDFHGGYEKGHRSYAQSLTWEVRDSRGSFNFINRVAAFTVAELLHLIGKPMLVPAEGAADYLGEELIRIWQS